MTLAIRYVMTSCKNRYHLHKVNRVYQYLHAVMMLRTVKPALCSMYGVIKSKGLLAGFGPRTKTHLYEKETKMLHE